MRHHGRAPVSDFAVLEPLDEAGDELRWTAAVPIVSSGSRSGAHRRPSGHRHLDPLGALGAPPVPGPVGSVGSPPELLDVRHLVRQVGAVATKAIAWLTADPATRALGFAGLSPGSMTQGWPHHGSTVTRLVWAPVDIVAGTLRRRTRWDTLRLADRPLVPMPDDEGWRTTGRLSVRWTVPVRVELRLMPTTADRTWTHLLLTSHARYPSQYWTSGHRALGALDAATRRLIG